MQNSHEDADHPKHCKETKFLMYWETETGRNMFSGSTAPQLDAQCLADLRANGGR
jgi:hypothetical protein